MTVKMPTQLDARGVAAHRDVKITHVLATEPAYAVNRRIRPLTLSRSAGDGVAAVLRRVLHVVGLDVGDIGCDCDAAQGALRAVSGGRHPS